MAGLHPPFAYAAVHDSGRYTLVRLYGVCRKRKADGRGFQNDEMDATRETRRKRRAHIGFAAALRGRRRG